MCVCCSGVSTSTFTELFSAINKISGFLNAVSDNSIDLYDFYTDGCLGWKGQCICCVIRREGGMEGGREGGRGRGEGGRELGREGGREG